VTKFLLFLGALAFFAPRVAAQTQTDDPRTHHDQNSINRCAAQQANQAEDALKQVYDKLIAAAGAESEAGQKIALSEQAWSAYRDAFLLAYFPKRGGQAVYGSMYSAELSSIRKHLAEQHIADLKELLTRYSH
jgi:uncharacterized protein YecT (DUF1311 family)